MQEEEAKDLHDETRFVAPESLVQLDHQVCYAKIFGEFDAFIFAFGCAVTWDISERRTRTFLDYLAWSGGVLWAFWRGCTGLLKRVCKSELQAVFLPGICRGKTGADDFDQHCKLLPPNSARLPEREASAGAGE